MAKTLCSAVFALLFISLSSTVSAQVVIEMSSTVEGSVDRMYVKDGMMRVNSQAGGTDSSMIFRGDEMLMLDHGSRSYYRFGQEEVAQMSEQMSEARRQMEEQLANVPPDQRAMIERMLGDRMAMMGSAPEPLRVERMGSSQAGDYSCTEYQVFRGDARQVEICAASVSDLGAAAQEARQVFEAMAEFTQQLTEAFSQGPLAGMIQSPYESMAQIDGFPVRTRSFNGDQVTSEVTVTSISREAIDDALFSPPAEYEQQQLPQMSR